MDLKRSLDREWIIEGIRNEHGEDNLEERMRRADGWDHANGIGPFGVGTQSQPSHAVAWRALAVVAVSART